ncbi:MAG: glycosyltransferase, partial [Synechococcus sp.]
DVALLPLQLNSYTRNMFPMKFFEYLAAAVPVVATAIPSLERFRDSAVLVAPGADQLELAIIRVLQGQGPERSGLIALARQHTYRQRTQSMLAVLEQLGVLEASGSAKPPLRHDALSA